MIKKNAMRRTVSAFLLGMVCLTAVAQGKKVTGVITDSKGEPLIGASVKIKGSSKGVITDMDGKYTLPGTKDGDVLVISYIGCEPQELKVGSTNNYNVQLRDNSQSLNELVVIGYGTVQKKDLTGSVSTLSADDISSVPVSSVTEAMSGKMAGVNITATEGSPDADIKIRVRGGGSLSQDNSPLYIVDGFPVSSISDIAPSEIQSIDVLKDASSTAIYGARGANGVIIITTKSGKEGKIKVDFGAYYGFRKASKFQKVLSPYDYAYYQYELGSSDYYGNFQDLDIWKSVKGTDYQDEIFGRTGNQTNYNVNVSGGSNTLKFNISYAHNDEKSIMLNSGYQKENINAKLNATLNKWLSLDFNARLSYTNIDGMSGGADQNESSATTSIVANAVRWRPIEALAADTGDDETSTSQKSPLERLLATDKHQPRFNQTYNVGLNWTPFKNWTFRSEFGYTWKYEEVNQIWGSDATQNSKYGYMGQPQADYLRTNKKNWRNANTLTYDNKKLFGGRDRINVLLGHEVSSSWSTAVENTSVAFPSTMSIEEIKANMGSGTALPTQTTLSAKDNMLSFFGRVNYTMMDKYLLTVTMRADGSSKFAKGNQWGLFPSAALAWRLSDEKFMANTKSWLSNLKVRLSFGTAGNNRINSGLIYPTYKMGDNTGKLPYFNETLGTSIMFSDNLYNPNLKWETTITRNLGFDYGFWNNRISGSLDIYWNTTKDLLMRADIPANTGFTYQYQNFGKTSNKGVEFTVNALLVNKKNASLNFTFNVSYNKNKIDELNTDSPWQNYSWLGSTLKKYENFRVEQGGRLGEIWAYRTDGFFTPYDPQKNPNGELILEGSTWKLREGLKNNSSSITGGLYPGAMKLKVDENGDPVKERIGNTIAPVTGGFGFNGNVGNFDFNVFCNYSIGNKIINGTKLMTSFFSDSKYGYNLNDDFRIGNRYTWIDPSTGMNLGKLSNSVINYYGSSDAIISRLLEINAGANIYNPASASTMQLTDYAIEDASFLRINNVTVGYTFPKKWIKKLFMESVRIYFTGYNLACFTKYSGPDPEVDTMSKKNAMTIGVDYSSYPKSRSFVGGINISF